MSTISIFGTWQLTSVSDNYPRVDLLSPDIPLSAYLRGNEGEEYIIRQSHVDNTSVEEILLSYRSVDKQQLTRAYQLGKWNVEKYAKDKVVGSIIIGTTSLDSDDLYISPDGNVCKAFIILRYGQMYSIQSSERYSLSLDGSTLTIEIEINFAGVHTSLVKYLKRKTTFETIPLRMFSKTSGWLRESNRNAHILRAAEVKYVKAYVVMSPNVTDVNAPQDASSLNSSLCITRRIGDQITDGSSVTVFLYEVKCSNKTWRIVHRYKEFDALRMFITSRKKPLPARYWKDSGEEPSFPAKRALTLRPNTKALEDRARGLQDYLMFHVSRGGHDIPGIIDTLCSFLEIPEHLYEAAESPVKAAAPTAIAPTVDSRGTSFASIMSASASNHDDHGHSNTGAIPIGTMGSYHSSSTSNILNDTKPPPGLGSMNRRASANVAISHTTPIATSIPTFVEYKPPANYNSFSELSTIVPLVSNSTSNLLEPVDALFFVLSAGLMVIKHGRQGKPQKRLLRCNEDMSRIYWQDEPSQKIIDKAKVDKEIKLPLPDNSKSVNLGDVYSVRRATEFDYTTTDGKKEIGTQVFRKNKLSLADLELCFSLITLERTFDLQCFRKADFDFLYNNLSVLVNSKRK